MRIGKYGCTLVFLTSLLFSSVCSATTIEEALVQYKNNEFEAAFRSFKDLAAIGNTKAQFNIGVMYARGEFVEADLVESWAWFKLVELNQAKEDPAKALAVLEEKLDSQKMAMAEKRLEVLMERYSNSSVQQNLLPALSKSENSAFVSAKPTLANNPVYPMDMLNRGVSGVVDVEYLIEKDGTVRYPTVLATSDKSFTRASLKALAKNRFVPASLDGKPVYEYGRRMRFIFQMAGAEIDHKRVTKIVEPLKKDALEGGGQAKYTYAYTISMLGTLGSGMEGYEELELENANMWFSKAAQDGFSPAKYELGKRLAYGQYCAVDNNKALFWLEQAADQGLAEANLMLGMEYISGARTQRNVEKGLQLIKQAADTGYEHAMLRYAWIIATSPEVDKKELKIAQNYFDKIKPKDYNDLLSYYETMTVLALAQGEFQNADKAWNKGMKEMKKRDLESGRMLSIKKSIDGAQTYIEL